MVPFILYYSFCVSGISAIVTNSVPYVTQILIAFRVVFFVKLEHLVLIGNGFNQHFINRSRIKDFYHLTFRG